MNAPMPEFIHVRSSDPVYKHLPREAAKMESGKYWVRFLWPVEMVEAARIAHPRRRAKTVEAKSVDLLAAIFGVNRSAKRYRDAAQRNYQSGTHGFAGNCKERKESLYKLKDRGIVEAYRSGRLKAEGTHGVLTVYRGEGYCFHSLLRPVGLTLPALDFEANSAGCLYVEQKPKTAREPRLKDSIATLEALQKEESYTDFQRLSFPPRAGKRRFREEDEDERDYFAEDM